MVGFVVAENYDGDNFSTSSVRVINVLLLGMLKKSFSRLIFGRCGFVVTRKFSRTKTSMLLERRIQFKILCFIGARLGVKGTGFLVVLIGVVIPLPFSRCTRASASLGSLSF